MRFFLFGFFLLLSYLVAFMAGYFGEDVYDKNRFLGASIAICGTLVGMAGMCFLTGWVLWR